MSFFKNLTLERVFIILSALGSLVLIYTGVNLSAKLGELEDGQSGAPAIAKEIQLLAKTHSVLEKAKAGDDLAGGKMEIQSYIYQCSTHTNAKIGQISISHNEKEIDRQRKLFDNIYTIKPQNSETTLRRWNVVNFLRELEAGSRQIRVTTLQLRLPRKTRIEPHDPTPDEWIFDAVCTLRVKQDA